MINSMFNVPSAAISISQWNSPACTSVPRDRVTYTSNWKSLGQIWLFSIWDLLSQNQSYLDLFFLFVCFLFYFIWSYFEYCCIVLCFLSYLFIQWSSSPFLSLSRYTFQQSCLGSSVVQRPVLQIRTSQVRIPGHTRGAIWCNVRFCLERNKVQSACLDRPPWGPEIGGCIRQMAV
jgi:hypothetical protein